jgi:uncharacterized protein (TIGR00369 family)
MAPVTFGDGAVHRMLGLEPLERSSAAAEVRMAVRPDFLQEEGVVQGGLVAALADAAAVYLLMPELPEDARMTSIEFKLNFLSPALEGEGPLVARAEPVKRGKRVGVCRSTVTQGDRAVAEGLFTYLLSGR